MFNLFKEKSPILDILPPVRGKYKENEPMKKHTWFAVGGPAEIMYLPADKEDLSFFMANRPRSLPLCVIGGGSNLLVRDGGIPGIVIKLDSPAFRKYKKEGDKLTCGAGLRNVDLVSILLKEECGGLEFLSTIPGAIGGSIKTNAGCYGSEVKDVIISAEVINDIGEIKEIPVEELQLSYRSSFFPEDWIITAITFQTHPEKPQTILEKINEMKNKRQKSQPHNVKTAGSTFKNPEGLKAWELIKKSGCADLSIGGAKVSEKHCNFLVNTGNATAKDIEDLGEEIIKRVKAETAITLEWEVKKIGINKEA